MKPVTAGELSLIKRHAHPSTMGSFERHLWEAIEHADSTNLDRLALGFPEHVAAQRSYANVPGYWHDLLAKADEEAAAARREVWRTINRM